MVRLKLNDDVHIALRSEVIPQNRAKQSQFPDMMTAAKIADTFLVDCDSCRH